MKEERIAEKYVHKFEVRDEKNFKQKKYPIPYKYRKQVNDQLKELIRQGIIEKCDTQFINPI